MNEEDRTRLEKFRQFRKEIRGSAENLLVGIDVAKEKHRPLPQKSLPKSTRSCTKITLTHNCLFYIYNPPQASSYQSHLLTLTPSGAEF